jgi:hypothetical protein
MALMSKIPTHNCGDYCWERVAKGLPVVNEFKANVPNFKLVKSLGVFDYFKDSKMIVVSPNRIVFNNVGGVLKKEVIGKITGNQDLSLKFSGFVDTLDNSYKIQLEVKGGPQISIPAGAKPEDAMVSVAGNGMYLEIIQPPRTLNPPKPPKPPEWYPNLECQTAKKSRETTDVSIGFQARS